MSAGTLRGHRDGVSEGRIPSEGCGGSLSRPCSPGLGLEAKDQAGVAGPSKNALATGPTRKVSFSPPTGSTAQGPAVLRLL